jgi:hypothetical protein
VTRNCAFLLLACSPLFAQHYRISTLAGQGAAGITLDNPTSVALDAAGDVYVGDWTGIIRKIWIRDHASTLVAGIGAPGFSGDGGLATSAMLGKGNRFTLDPAGNIYIAAYDSHRVRKIDASTGIISTIAGTGESEDRGDGGPALAAGIAQPAGITLDAEGNIYLCTSWSRVRKITISTGIIETIAGRFGTSYGGDGGPALEAYFWLPMPEAVNREGDVFIADYENSRIRVVSAKTGQVDTIAGSSLCETAPSPFSVQVCRGSYSGDGGPAIHAKLSYPSAAALDREGNLYIADTLNQRIRRVDAASGVITTIAGRGTKGFSGDGGSALAAELNNPTAIAVDPAGRVYFTDQGNNRVRVLAPSPRPWDLSTQRPTR